MADNSHIKKQVERLLPNWRSWYPSLFHAAEDLGIIRAQVCSPDSLMLSSRHAFVHSQALEAHRAQWGGNESINSDQSRKRKRKERRGREC